MSERALEPRLAVVETHVADNAAEIVKLRERMHTVEGTQSGVKLLAQQVEWSRQESERRDADQRDRETQRDRELREFVSASTAAAITAAFDRRGTRWSNGAALMFQAGGWILGLITLVLALTHHMP